MKIFAIGDTHLSMDPRIAKPMDKFGKAWTNHAERLKENWCEDIENDDYVIIAGDVSWALRLDEAKADFDWLHELPGQKLIFKGNHDLWWQSLTKLNALYMNEDGSQRGSMMRFMQNQSFMIPGTRTAVCGTRGWLCPGSEEFKEHDKTIYKRENIRLELSLEEAVKSGAEDIIAVLHFPPTNDKREPSGFTELLEKYGVSQCLYGHLHNQESHRKGIKGEVNGVTYRLIAFDYIGGRPLRVKTF